MSGSVNPANAEALAISKESQLKIGKDIVQNAKDLAELADINQSNSNASALKGQIKSF